MQWILRLRVFIIISLALILITTAVIFSVLRAVLPYATGYKNEIQQEISQQIGLPVEISSIDAAINWFSPRLKLIGVSVFDEKNKVPLFNFREAFVELDVVSSLLRLEIIIDDIGLVGADLSIEKLADDEWLIQGIRFTSEGSSELPDKFIYMLQNADYLLHDSNVYYQDHTGEKLNLNLLDVNIDVENNFNNHDIKFSMNLLESYGKDLAVVANLHGDLDALNGDIYIEAHELNLRQWNTKFKIADNYLLDSVTDVNLWIILEENKIKSLVSQLSMHDLSLQNKSTAKSWQTDYLETNVRYVDNNDYKSITLSDFYFGKDKLPSWGGKTTLTASEDENSFYLNADLLRIQDLPVITAVFLNNEQLAELDKVNAYQLQADVYNLDLQLPRDVSAAELSKAIKFEASVVDLSVHDTQNEITVSGFDGFVKYENQSATLEVSSSDTSFEFKNLFREVIFADTIQGLLNLQYQDSSWHLNTDRLQFKNAHINTYTRFEVELFSADDIFVNAQTDFYDAYGKYAKRYLPVGIMSPELVNWLDMAVTDGYVPDGSFVLYGRLNEFPYKHNTGVFQVLFSAQDINMRFLADWPVLNQLSATVKFENEGLFVSKAQAMSKDARLYNGRAEIPDLEMPHLTVNTDASGNNVDIQSYVWNSALDDMLGDTLRQFQLRGKSNLKLKIDVPLVDDEIDVAIDGHLDLIDSEIYYPALGYEISAINGTVDFTRDSLFSDSIDAIVEGEAVTINAFTQDDSAVGSSGREAVFHLDGMFDSDYLLQRYDWIPDYWVTGKSMWDINIELPYKPVDYLLHVKASSNLKNVSLDISDKVNKPANREVAFYLDMNVVENEGMQINSKAGYIDSAEAGKNTIFDLYASRDENTMWNFDIKSKYLTGQGAFTEGLDKDTQIKLDLANIDLHALFYTKDKRNGKPLIPADFPPLNWDAARVVWDDWIFTDARLETHWHEHGMLINKLSLNGPAMSFDARGSWLTSWRGAHETVLEGSISGNNLGETLTGLGFERSVDRSEYKANFDSKWPAEPYALSWANMKGKSSFELTDGEILEADPGAGGRLLGLLNIFKLANRLALDFDDVTREGFSFDYIKGDFEFINGDGSLKNFDVSAPAADINIFGSVGLLNRDYGLLMRVKPHTDTLTFAGGVLLGGVVIGAGLALIQKVFDLGVIGHNVYSVTGSWDDPVIEKIVERNQNTAEDDEDDF